MATVPHSPDRPLVSVVVPNYNHGRFLRDRLDSIINQVFQDFELILLDDASSDGSERILTEYATRPGTSVVLNKENSGSPFRQWNAGVARAKGEFVWIAEADDWASEDFLQTLVDMLVRMPAVGVAYARSAVVDEHGCHICMADEEFSRVGASRWQVDYVNDGREECRQYLSVRNTIPNASAVLFRRDIFEAIGRAPEHMRYAGDYLTWIRMLLRADVAYCSRPLNHFRQHDRSVRATLFARHCSVMEKYEVLSELSREVDVPPQALESTRQRMFDDWAMTMSMAGGIGFGRQDFRVWRRALAYDPLVTRRILQHVFYRMYGRSRLVRKVAWGLKHLRGRVHASRRGGGR